MKVEEIEVDQDEFAKFKLRIARRLARIKRKAINRARYERSYKRGPK